MKGGTGAGWYFSATHRDGERPELHGHSYEVVAWWPAGEDAVALQARLKVVLEAYDHKTLPDHLSRAEAIAADIMARLGDCVSVEISRPLERLFVRYPA